jgi:hypothetical protein
MDFATTSLRGEGIYFGCGEATRERDCFLLTGVAAAVSLATPAAFDAERERLFLTGLGSGTASFVTAADFDAERDRRLSVSIASDFPSASVDAVGVTAGAACALGLRPKPSALAIVDRRSE